MVDLQVDYAADDMFIYSYMTDLSPLGIFLRSNAPLKVGTRITLRFTPPGEDEPMEVDGEVRWVVPFQSDAPEARVSGMGVQFVNPPEALREKIIGLVSGAPREREGEGE